MQRPRIPIVAVLGIGIALATMSGLVRRAEASAPSFSRSADGDQRDAATKPEVRDAAEERIEQDEVTDPAHGPAIATRDASPSAPTAAFVRDPAPHLFAARRLGRARSIRGPPRPG